MLYTDSENRYKEIRESSGLTSEELGKELIKKCSGLNGQRIRKIECNRANPKYEEVKAYCDYFNATADYFYGYSGTPARDKVTKSSCEYLRLSDKSLTTIRSMPEEQKLILEAFINSPAIIEMTNCVDEWYKLTGKTMLVRGGDFTEETISEDTQNKIKEYVITERLKNILNHITHTRPVTNHFMRKKMINIDTNITGTILQNIYEHYKTEFPDRIDSGDYDDLVREIRNNLDKDIESIKSTDYYREFITDSKPSSKKSKKKGSDTK